jgi:hypothetical protein
MNKTEYVLVIKQDQEILRFNERLRPARNRACSKQHGTPYSVLRQEKRCSRTVPVLFSEYYPAWKARSFEA